MTPFEFEKVVVGGRVGYDRIFYAFMCGDSKFPLSF